jgi:hypothetical protein
MGAARERKDILWMLCGRYPGGQWRGRELLRRRWWRYGREDIWNDTIGRHWNRLVWCRIAGHRRVFNANDPGEPLRMYCPRCMHDV